MTPRRPQRPIRAIFVPNPLWWWAFGRLLAPHARHFEARRRRRAAARAVRRGHGVALDLRIQCHRLSDAALVITAPGRLVLFAQRSPWCGSSRLDVPDLRPAQTRTATSPHPLCAAPLLCAARESARGSPQRGVGQRTPAQERGGETGGRRQRGEALRWRDEALALD